MSDIKLFHIHGDTVMQLQGTSVAVEKSLQDLIERHLDTFLGVRFLAHEYKTGKTHGGRIDTLGIDENGSPVIIEYKWALNQNVINQQTSSGPSPYCSRVTRRVRGDTCRCRTARHEPQREAREQGGSSAGGTSFRVASTRR